MDAKKVVAVSGGFDPLHIGHVQMLEEARALGDELVVIMNNDHWLTTKKGFVFMPEAERVALLERYPFVDRVVLTDHIESDTDRSVSRTLEKIRPDIFANGGDRGETNTPEADVAERLGIKMAYGIGGGKIQSSSWMTAHAASMANQVRGPWGSYKEHAHGDGWNLRTVHLLPGSLLEAESPTAQSTAWILMEGDVLATTSVQETSLRAGEAFQVPAGVPCSLSSVEGCAIIEIIAGEKSSQSDMAK